jgi:glyceraldehyde-3-phosphate dehydrogenase/erythrose-4-phosphate dehydrogenase
MSQGKLVKVFGWYDNEMGYSNRLVDMTMIVGKKKSKKVAAKKKPKKVAAKRPVAAKKK